MSLHKPIVQILGRIDAIFSPQRDFSRTSCANFAITRQQYLAWGLQIRSTGPDRQGFSRQLESLERGGQVVVSRRRKSLFPSVRLTPAAEESARAACGLPCIAAGWASLRRVAQLSDAAGREWVPEWVLCGWDGPRGAVFGSAEMTEIVLVESMARPALCRGWLDSRSTRDRHACYRVLPRGRAALADDQAPADAPEDLDDSFDSRLWDTYRAAFDSQRRALMTGKPTDPQEIGVPWLSPDFLLWPKEAAR